MKALQYHGPQESMVKLVDSRVTSKLQWLEELIDCSVNDLSFQNTERIAVPADRHAAFDLCVARWNSWEDSHRRQKMHLGLPKPSASAFSTGTMPMRR